MPCDVLIIMGSDSDWEVMSAAAKALGEFGVAYEAHVSSAHRAPDRTIDLVRQAPQNGVKLIIAGAGAAAHLAGLAAAVSPLPVIAVPLAATTLGGLDALLSSVQMPAGVPVAVTAIGEAGARNAGLFAVRILALQDAKLAAKLAKYREKIARQVDEKDRKLQQKISGR